MHSPDHAALRFASTPRVMITAFLLGLAGHATAAPSNPATPTPPPTTASKASPPSPPVIEDKAKYTAFDLARNEIRVDSLVAGEQPTGEQVFAGASSLSCEAGPSTPGGPAQVVVKPDAARRCPLFADPDPGSFVVRVSTTNQGVAGPTHSITVDFDKGSLFSGSVSFDGSQLHIAGPFLPSARADICFAYYSLKDSQWVAVTNSVTAQPEADEVVVPLALFGVSGTVYAMYGACPHAADATPPATVLRLTYPTLVMHDIAGPHGHVQEFDCKDKPGTPGFTTRYDGDPGPSYEICIDQANALGEARIIRNQDHYIKTFSFGRITIRHWKNVVPVVTIAGAGIALSQAGFAGAGVTPGPTSDPPRPPLTSGGFALPGTQDGQGISGTTMGDYLVSTVFIPPHAPGAMHVDIRFVDPGDAKPKAATAIDLAVDQGYSGALRLGVAHVFWSHDRSYSKLQRGPGLPKEIVETSATSNEVVAGYAVFLDGIGWRAPAGRTYAICDPGAIAFIRRHVGVYFGFGALSYSPGNVDFLKSIHAGLDIELTRNLSIAVTGVLRRTQQLGGGLHAGGPAPEGDLPMSNRYEGGLAIVLNFSTEFAKFATSSPTTGASR